MWSHTTTPSGFLAADDVLRVYVGVRDREGRTRPTYFDCRPDDPRDVFYVHEQPVLELGALGAFDDSGVMPSCVVATADRTYLYYVGWNLGVTVPYRNSIGLAVSEDGGRTFLRSFDGPLFDRSPVEPYYAAMPWVTREGSLWRMWYSSTTGWEVIEGRPEPRYLIKSAESADGIHWKLTDQVCIAPADDREAVGRPCVLLDSAGYRMWYCYRGTVGYRSDKRAAYRIGYAESADGTHWERKDGEVGIDASESGWDSRMIEYPYVYAHGDRLRMLYNGDGFGKTGVGYAVLEAG